MKQLILLSLATIFFLVLVACGGTNGEMETQSHGENAVASMQKMDSMKSLEEWVRTEPVDVKAVDVDQDGFVYQDPMDWNIIADEEGKCPKCGMLLVKVPLEEAVKNLTENGYTVR